MCVLMPSMTAKSAPVKITIIAVIISIIIIIIVISENAIKIMFFYAFFSVVTYVE